MGGGLREGVEQGWGREGAWQGQEQAGEGGGSGGRAEWGWSIPRKKLEVSAYVQGIFPLIGEFGILISNFPSQSLGIFRHRALAETFSE